MPSVRSIPRWVDDNATAGEDQSIQDGTVDIQSHTGKTEQAPNHTTYTPNDAHRRHSPHVRESAPRFGDEFEGISNERPFTYNEAISGIEVVLWKDAMQVELTFLMSNGSSGWVL